MHLRDRIARARVGPKDGADVFSEYAAMKSGIVTDTTESVTRSVTDNLMGVHKKQVTKLLSQIEALETKLDSVQESLSVSKQRGHDQKADHSESMEKITKDSSLIRSNWESTKKALASYTEDHSSEMLDEKLISQQLIIKVATLEGQLKEAKKGKGTTVVAPTVPPVVIPDFEFTPTRGMDGYATSWTAKPKRAH